MIKDKKYYFYNLFRSVITLNINTDNLGWFLKLLEGKSLKNENIVFALKLLFQTGWSARL